MAIFSQKDEAQFETSKRLLTQLINEGLVKASINIHKQTLELSALSSNEASAPKMVTVGMNHFPARFTKTDVITSIVRPEFMKSPILLSNGQSEWIELEPGAIFTFVSAWFPTEIDPAAVDRVAQELQNSSLFQEKWLEIAAHKLPPQLKSPLIEWEQSVIVGHPTHPLNKSCFALPPLDPISPDDIMLLIKPRVSFISVLRSSIQFTGPFEKMMKPLFEKLDIPTTTDDRVVVPCFTLQLPAIRARFADVTVVKTVENCFNAQASLRTLTPIPQLDFPYHIKLPIAVQITSAIRTITPWTAASSPMVTEILDKLNPSLPDSLWLFREEAAFSGSQGDFDDAKHLSCILRDDIELKATANNESLIIATALFERDSGSTRTRAERVFGLNTDEKKINWFTRYVRCLFETVFPPGIQFGIGFEAHQQNSVVRVCKETGHIKGFAIRDYGGIRIHKPTLRHHGISTDWEIPGGIMLTDDLSYVWDNFHHALFQNHISHLVYSLGLGDLGGWNIVREEVASVLKQYADEPNATQLLDFLMRETMNLKCFLRMRLEGIYRSNIEKELPNIILG